MEARLPEAAFEEIVNALPRNPAEKERTSLGVREKSLKKAARGGQVVRGQGAPVAKAIDPEDPQRSFSLTGERMVACSVKSTRIPPEKPPHNACDCPARPCNLCTSLWKTLNSALTEGSERRDIFT